MAFYTATNRTNRPIDGVSTYNVVPFEAGQYFNKIQCFCFEEQRLNPNEQASLSSMITDFLFPTALVFAFVLSGGHARLLLH